MLIRMPTWMDRFPFEGVTGQYTFEQLRAGVTTSDGRMLTWFGNKRTLLIKVAS